MIHEGSRWLIIEVCIVHEDCIGCIGLVYGSYDEFERMNMYSELPRVVQNLEKPCIIMGDYNEIIEIGDMRGQTIVRTSMKQFYEFISNNQFMTINLMGTQGGGNSRSRIYWCLSDSVWVNRFLRMQLIGLPKNFLNHNHLLLQLEGIID